MSNDLMHRFLVPLLRSDPDGGISASLGQATGTPSRFKLICRDRLISRSRELAQFWQQKSFEDAGHMLFARTQKAVTISEERPCDRVSWYSRYDDKKDKPLFRHMISLSELIEIEP